MGKMKNVHLLGQWIGEDARKAADAYHAGDDALLKACLDSIQYYAADLGYRPAATEEEADVAGTQHE